MVTNPAAAAAVAGRYRDVVTKLKPKLNSTDIASVDFSAKPPTVDAGSSSANWAGIKQRLNAAQSELAELGRISREPAATGMSTIGEDPMATLGTLRQLARSLRADAMRAAETKDAATAAERILTIILIGRHLSQQGDLLQALTGAAIIDLGILALEDVQSSGSGITLAPEQKQSLLAGFDSLDANDPAGILTAARSAPPDAKSSGDIDGAAQKIAAAVKTARASLK